MLSPATSSCQTDTGGWMGQNEIDGNLKSVAVVAQNTRMYGYVNGQQVVTQSWDSLMQPVSLGICDKNGHSTNSSSQYNVSQCSLYVKDVRVYDRVLSASEIAQL